MAALLTNSPTSASGPTKSTGNGTRRGGPNGKRKAQSITVQEALSILQSAVSYCQSAGMAIRAANNGTGLALTIGGAHYVLTNGGTGAEFRMGVAGNSGTESPAPMDGNNGTPAASETTQPGALIGGTPEPNKEQKDMIIELTNPKDRAALAEALREKDRPADITPELWARVTGGTARELQADELRALLMAFSAPLAEAVGLVAA